MKSGLFVDSWGWIVLANRNEPSFPETSHLYQEVTGRRGPIVTTDYILDEVITFLYSKIPPDFSERFLQGLFSSIETGFVALEKISAERFEAAWQMRRKYEDKPKISFTDFTSFVVMREMSLQKVLTNDHHFEEVNLGFERVPYKPLL